VELDDEPEGMAVMVTDTTCPACGGADQLVASVEGSLVGCYSCLTAFDYYTRKTDERFTAIMREFEPKRE
jgi:hypothetical protein